MKNFSTYLLGIFILLSQFYIFDSGGVQPSFALAALISIFIVPWIKNSPGRGIDFKIYKQFFAFALFSFAVNLFWSFMESDGSFILSSLYYIFNILLFISICESVNDSNSKIVIKSIYISISLLVFIYLAGLGRYDFYPRYNAYFNDPNQMAFWALCLVSLCLIIYHKFSNRFNVDVVFFLCSVIILVSQSRSALVGFMLVFLGYIYRRFSKLNGKADIVIILLICMTAAYYASSYIGLYGFDISSFSGIFERLQNTDISEQSQNRGYNRIVDYPEMLIFGAGQGLDGRFMGDGEIHSTWAGILFYYGIFGLILFILPISVIFRRLDWAQRIVFLGPVFYSFSTFGARTPIFWVFLAFSFLASTKLRNTSKGNSDSQQTHSVNTL